MIIAEFFQGDSLRIARIQASVYLDALAVIVKQATSAYSQAEEVIGEQTELGQKLNELQDFDHRALQDFHDYLAAAFRYKYCMAADLFEHDFDADDSQKTMIGQWFSYLYEQLDELFQHYLSVPRYLATAVCFPNPEPMGVEAEDQLYAMLRTHYSELSEQHESWLRGLGFLKPVVPA